MNISLAASLTTDSIVDGPGLRMVLWTQGCLHQCKGCHNPQTHSLTGGMELPVESVIEQMMMKVTLQQGLTISGGEPFLQARALVPIASAVRQRGLDIWIYTGFTWEQLRNFRDNQYEDRTRLLQQADVLVDGRFIENKASVSHLFRGSSNQRIIDVARSLEMGSVALFDEISSVI